MQEQRALLNRTLTGLFNDILRIEERVLSTGDFSDLSVREMHVLEAVAAAGEQNSMSAIAGGLGITVGSLTVAVSTLVRKGYVQRSPAPYDRRIVQVVLTEKGRRADAHHHAFHEDMINRVLADFTAEDMQTLRTLLVRLEDFFADFPEPKPDEHSTDE